MISISSSYINICLLCLHGVGGNFYSSTLFDALQPVWLEHGFHVLRVNTRGHDGFAFGSGPRRRQGAAFEIVDECRQDLQAWLDFLRDRSFGKVITAGHSLGAIKSVYAASHPESQPHPIVAGQIVMSPPRLSYTAFNNGEQSAEFFADMQTAEGLRRSGSGEAIFPARVPFPILISADCFVDKYGPQERYNILNMIDRIPYPTLFTYGELELANGGIAFAGLPEAIRERQSAKQSIGVATIAGANHMYSQVELTLASEIDGWLERSSIAS